MAYRQSRKEHKMGFKDLFKSTNEIMREKRRAKRRAERDVQRIIERIAGRIKTQEKERAKIWAKAKELLQAGKKLEATRCLQRYKGIEVLVDQMERQRMLWQGKLNALSIAGDANEISGALAGFGDMLNVDPDKIADDIERIEEVEGEIAEVGSVLDSAYERDNEKIAQEAAELGDVAVDAELMNALESEAAADILGGKVVDSAKDERDINSGRDRLRELLDEK